jgi:hyperosmotically inducible periplasmic protein
MKNGICIAMALFSTLLATSCTERQRDRAEHRAKQAADRAENTISEASITTAVKAKLAADVRLVTLTSVNVDTKGTTVTLSGTVPTVEDSQQAERVAKTVDGVTSVVNILTIKP